MIVRRLEFAMTDDLTLTEAEKRVVDCAERGKLCDFGEDDPSEGEGWGDERTVRAEVIYALCCGTRDDWSVHAKGVRIQGAQIAGALDFENATLRYPLHLLSCFLPEPL